MHSLLSCLSKKTTVPTTPQNKTYKLLNKNEPNGKPLILIPIGKTPSGNELFMLEGSESLLDKTTIEETELVSVSQSGPVTQSMEENENTQIKPDNTKTNCSPKKVILYTLGTLTCISCIVCSGKCLLLVGCKICISKMTLPAKCTQTSLSFPYTPTTDCGCFNICCDAGSRTAQWIFQAC